MIDHALAELEKGEEKAVDWDDPKNWIPGRTVLGYDGKHRIFLGKGTGWFCEENRKASLLVLADGFYTFLFNLPDPAEIKNG